MISSPDAMPSVKRGIVTTPSARTSEVMTPAPRCTGVATIRSPTRPSRTRSSSSSPIGEATLRVITACACDLGGASRPRPASISGFTNSSVVSADDLIDGAKHAGLDGICLTEHDQFWLPKMLTRLPSDTNFWS